MLALTAKSIHFVGIGGIGMSALAQILLARGYTVSGSDLHDTPMIQRLRSLGARVALGHRTENVNGAELLVTSTAIAESNEELLAARQRGIPSIHRADLLNALMGEGISLAVTGTHGKTTTAALLAWTLETAGVGGTAILGGEVPQLQGNARLGNGQLIVAEVDESDKTIQRMTARVVLITNLEPDHLDHYRDMEEIIATVQGFAERARTLLLCWDDPGVRRLAERLGDKPFLTYGLDSDADFQVRDLSLQTGGSTFRIAHRGQLLGSFLLALIGRHNVSNALGVAAAACSQGIPVEHIAAAFRSFTGVRRRLQEVGTVNGISVFDDYAHHPTEIAATIAAARLHGRPVTVIFQPHRYSRTLALLDSFPAAFAQADRIVITDIYPAGEDKQRYPIETETLVDRVRAANPDKSVHHWPTFSAVLAALPGHLQPGDLVLALGAGDIPKLSAALFESVQAEARTGDRDPGTTRCGSVTGAI